MKAYRALALFIFLSVLSFPACIPPDDPFSSSGCNTLIKPASGLITLANNSDSSKLLSNGSDRTYYLKLPEKYDSRNPYPLVIAFHGTGGSHDNYLADEEYNLQGAVGNEAILIYPNALPSGSGVNQWNYAIDIDFFDDVIEDLESRVCYDTRQVFAVGHSSGAGITHQLGCLRGNVLRGIAPVAGSLLGEDCTQEVAVMQIHGITDTSVPISTGEQSRNFWIEYNSCNCDETIDAEYSECVQYPDCDQDYPVYWCPHEYEDPSDQYPGHAWPPFAGETIWGFFKNLPLVDPSLAAPTKSGECASKETTMMQFSIRFPDDFGTPAGFMAMTLYDQLGMEQPLLTQPDYILNFEAELLEYGSGKVFSYSVEGNITGVPLPGDYTFSVIVYMEGGNYPIPTSDLDYVGLTEIHIDTDGQIIIDDPIALEVLQSFE
jgi:polyhydroxybutyrate depolymerase